MMAATARANITSSQSRSASDDRRSLPETNITSSRARLPAGVILPRRKKSVAMSLHQVNETLGASRSAACSISNRCASWKLNIEAMIVVGNTSRWVL